LNVFGEYLQRGYDGLRAGSHFFPLYRCIKNAAISRLPAAASQGNENAIDGCR